MLGKILWRLLSRPALPPRQVMTLKRLGNPYDRMRGVWVGDDLSPSYKGGEADCLRFIASGGTVRP